MKTKLEMVYGRILGCWVTAGERIKKIARGASILGMTFSDGQTTVTVEVNHWYDTSAYDETNFGLNKIFIKVITNASVRTSGDRFWQITPTVLFFGIDQKNRLVAISETAADVLRWRKSSLSQKKTV